MRTALNARQRDAVQALDEHILCCACPGSGKTRVLEHRARTILAEDPRASLVMVTFTREAAAEMRRRVGSAPNLAVGSFHSLALAQLRSIGWNRRIASSFVAREMVDNALAVTAVAIAPEVAAEAIARAKVDPEFASANPDAGRLAEAYDALLATAGCCDFTDILLDAVRGMEQGTLAPLPAGHFLVDEFQDIDALQFRWLMAHLAQRCVCCAVGDDDQSIYAFRRALGYAGMMEFVAATGARIVVLDTNYRSTPQIVGLAATLIANNLDRVPKLMHAARAPGRAPERVRLATVDDRNARLVRDLTEICGGQPAPCDDAGRSRFRFGVRPGQVAVLARANHQLREAHAVLRTAGIPSLRLGVSIWDVRAAQLFADLLLALAERQGPGLLLALRWARVPVSVVEALTSQGAGTLYGLLTAPPPAATGGPVVETFLEYARHAALTFARSGAAPGEVAARITAIAAWMTDVLRGVCGMEPDEREEHLEGALLTERAQADLEAIEAVRDFILRRSGSVKQRLFAARREREDAVDRVVLTTFHAAKGLEWDHVIVIDAVAGTVPKLPDDGGTDQDLAEERRLFYVALTRARDHLVLYTGPGAESEFIAEAFAPARADERSITISQGDRCLQATGELGQCGSTKHPLDR